MMKERIRFAPSPTGFLHVGGLRTALYGYLVAKQSKGSFILRIEDTDRARFVEGAEEDITKTLEEMGLELDEGPSLGGQYGPYRQSERLGIYKKYADELIQKGMAYAEDGAVYLKMPEAGRTEYTDVIRGHVAFDNSLEENFVIMKADGYPTYNFANVVDDHLMKITTVIRGEEFISSMPKHLSLYNALGFREPRFAHLPLILGTDKKKLSKRTGDASVSDYLMRGYLKEALLNFLVLLGWHPKGNEEILTIDEMISSFSLERVQSSPAVFDQNKLDFLGREWIGRVPSVELYQRALGFGIGKLDEKTAIKMLELIRTRITTLSQIAELGYFLLAEGFDVPKELRKIIEASHIEAAADSVDKIDKFQADELEKWGRELARRRGFTPGDFFMSLRIALLGRKVSPPLFESMELLGKSKVKERLLSYN